MRTCSWLYSRKPSGTMVSLRLTAVPRASNWGLHTKAQRGVGFTATSRLRFIRPHRGCWCKARPTCFGWMNISLRYMPKLRSHMHKNQLYGSKSPSVMESAWNFQNLTKGSKNVPKARMIWRTNVSMPYPRQVTPRYARQARYQPCQATVCYLLQATVYQPGDRATVSHHRWATMGCPHQATMSRPREVIVSRPSRAAVNHPRQATERHPRYATVHHARHAATNHVRLGTPRHRSTVSYQETASRPRQITRAHGHQAAIS